MPDSRVEAIISSSRQRGVIALGGDVPGLADAIAAVLPAADDLTRVEASHTAAQEGLREVLGAMERLRRRALDGHAIDSRQLGKTNADVATAKELVELTEQAVSAARGRLDAAASPIDAAIRDEGMARLRRAQQRHRDAQASVETAHRQLNETSRAESSIQSLLDRHAGVDAVRLFALAPA